jgi:hypothetical protein
MARLIRQAGKDKEADGNGEPNGNDGTKDDDA